MAEREEWMPEESFVHVRRNIEVTNITGNDIISLIEKYHLGDKPIQANITFENTENDISEIVNVHCRHYMLGAYRKAYKSRTQIEMNEDPDRYDP